MIPYHGFLLFSSNILKYLEVTSIWKSKYYHKISCLQSSGYGLFLEANPRTELFYNYLLGCSMQKIHKIMIRLLPKL